MKLLRLCLILCAWLALPNQLVWALGPAPALTQYKHTRWTIDEGAPDRIKALAQGRDGYLWIASGAGLHRFDGLTFEPIEPQRARPAGNEVGAILAARNGDLWVGYAAGGTAFFRDGVLHDVPMPDPAYVTSLVQTADGAIWASLGRRHRQLARFEGGRWTQIGTDWGLPAEHVIDILAGRDGALWVASTQSVQRLQRGSKRFARTQITASGFAALSEDAAGTIWMSNAAGSRAIADAAGHPIPVPQFPYPATAAERHPRAGFDRAGNLWGYGKTGIFRLNTPQVNGASSRAAAAAAISHFQQKDGLTALSANTILEDREGNIWVGTPLGLDRFRRVPVIVEPSLTKSTLWGHILLGASDGNVYVGEADAVYRIRPGGVPEKFFEGGEAEAICESMDGAIWLVFKDRIVSVLGQRRRQLPSQGATDQGISDCAVDHDGQLWLTGGRDGIFRYTAGRWQRFLVPPHEGGFPPSMLLRTQQSAIMVAFDDAGVRMFTPDGRAAPPWPETPSLGHIMTLYEGRNGLLAGGNFGIGQLRDKRTTVVSAKRYPFLRHTSGIVQTPAGETWLNTDAGLVRMPTAALEKAMADPRAPLPATVLDFRDGMPGRVTNDSVRDAVLGGDGRIWFGTTGGAVWVNPAAMTRNVALPPVAIRALKVGNRVYRDPTKASLPAGTARLEIDFAVLSLSIPERVRVRYRLEGEDGGWIDPGQRRQAFYTNLGPGRYVFRVIGSNDQGLWNRSGATLQFDIPPTFVQSRWFTALCVLAAGILLWLLYSLRLRRVTGEMRTRLEARLAERERIARDLHDTLLQGFQGLILRFQSVANEIPEGQRARVMIDQALDSADAVVEEGRGSVLKLRSAGRDDLAGALAEAAGRLRDDHSVPFKMVVEGEPRPLHPVVREELSRIGTEALSNAFRHARATTIELALSYHHAALLLGVRDDGTGIAPDIVQGGGRQGHFGLAGMRERAAQIDAEIKIASRTGSGTEILVRVPARLAYDSGRAAGWRRWLRDRIARGTMER